MNEKNEKEREKHLSFGMIGFSRVNSRGTRFYGSELEQDNYIKMRLYGSEVEHTLSKNWYFTDGRLPLAEVRMTSGQFAEMITSMNRGEGVPCTIEMLNKQPVPELPNIENRKEFVHRKFEDRMKEFSKSIKENQNKAKEIIKKKTLSKDDIHNLTYQIEWLTSEITNNIPFFAKCFQETMDEVVLEAKIEVENAIQHKINLLGIEALKSEMNDKLLNPSSEYTKVIETK